MTAIGKKRRIRVPQLAAFGIHVRHLNRRSAGRRHFEESLGVFPRKDDGAVAAPGGAERQRSVADRLRGAAIEPDALQLAVREEADRARVGRPEGQRRRSRADSGEDVAAEGPGLQRVERTHPKRRLLARAASEEDESFAVRRDGREGRDGRAGRAEHDTIGRREREANG